VGFLDRLLGRGSQGDQPGAEVPGGLNVLVVDPSVTILKVIELTLSPSTVQGVASRAEALDLLKRQPFALVISAIVLPDGDGYELCRSIKSLHHLPVILLPGSFEPFDETKARFAGADAIVKKPFEPNALIAAVQRVASSG
jgi:CheY-like chemotaxis protein